MQKELFTTKKDLLDAQAAVEEGTSLEPILKQRIVGLEDEKRELMVLPCLCVDLTLLLNFATAEYNFQNDLDKTGGKLKEVQKKLIEAMSTVNALEHEREQQDETIRELEVNLKHIQWEVTKVCAVVGLTKYQKQTINS